MSLMGIFIQISIFVFLILGLTQSPMAQSKPKADSHSVTQQIDQLIRGQKVNEAFMLAEAQLKKNPKDKELLWRHSRLLVLKGNQTSDEKKKIEYYEKGRAQAQKTIDMDKNFMIGYLRKSVANGRLALFKGILSVRSLVLETRADVKKAIELNNSTPYNYALAHYILGRTHASLAKKPKALRFPLGLAWGNKKKAEELYKKAISIYPNSVPFQKSYGEFLMDEGKKAQAKKHLKKAIELPVTDPGDVAVKAEAKKLLKDLQE